MAYIVMAFIVMAWGYAEERQSWRVLVRRLRAVSHVLHLRKGDLSRHISERYTVTAHAAMAFTVMAHIVMASVVMARMDPSFLFSAGRALKRPSLRSYGLYNYGLYRYGLESYGLLSRLARTEHDGVVA